MTLDTKNHKNGADHSAHDQSQLARVLDTYLADIEAGRAIDPQTLIQANPHLADRLRACLSILQLANQVEAPKATSTPTHPALNTRLGDFQILRIVGRGGMGIVFEAEQLSLHRRVALKILPFAAALDPLQLRRFQIEAQAAAQLHHTNIVPIFSIGNEQGVHYYAMQFIEGQTLATLISNLQGRAIHSFRYRERPTSESIQNNGLQAGPSDAPPCKGGVGGGSDECHCLSKSPKLPRKRNVLYKAGVGAGSSSPSIQTITAPIPSTIHAAAHFQTVARLGQQAAEALHHAHQLGVIHRDIKPSNLLIDTRGTLWITDFGLARIQSDSTLTMTGDIIGTLRYMSPEQSSGGQTPVDHRADIYSLGATLYELATLHPVHNAPDRATLIRQMTVEDPTPPRKHNPAIPKDLETIILKSLTKDPAHRYSTTRELAEDFQRFLDHKMIRARRPTPFDHLVKWLRRHRTAVTTAIVSLTICLGLAVICLAIFNRRIQAEKKRADQEKGRAELGFAKAREVVDRLFTKTAQKLTEIPRAGQLRHELLQEALTYYQGFLDEQGSNPAVKYETARAYLRMGKIYQTTIGEFDQTTDSQVLFRAAIELLEQVLLETPTERRFQEALAEAHSDFAITHTRASRHEQAIAERKSELELRQGLAHKFPDVAEYRRRLALAHTEFGNTLQAAGDLGNAEFHDRQALAIWKSIHPNSEVSTPQDFADESQIRLWLGRVLKLNHRLEESQQEVELSLKAREKQAAIEPNRPNVLHQLARNQWELASIYVERGEPAKAESLCKQSIEINKKLMADFPEIVDYQRRVGAGYSLLRDLLAMQRRDSEAETAAREAVGTYEKLAVDRPQETFVSTSLIIAYRDLGKLLYKTNQQTEAKRVFLLAKKTAETLAERFPQRDDFIAALADFLVVCPDPTVRDLPRAIQAAHRATELQPRDPQNWQLLGVAHYQAGHWDHATQALESAVNLTSGDNPELWLLLCMAYWKCGQPNQARTWLDKANQWMSRNPVNDLDLLKLRKTANSLIQSTGRETSAKLQ